MLPIIVAVFALLSIAMYVACLRWPRLYRIASALALVMYVAIVVLDLGYAVDRASTGASFRASTYAALAGMWSLYALQTARRVRTGAV